MYYDSVAQLNGMSASIFISSEDADDTRHVNAESEHQSHAMDQNTRASVKEQSTVLLSDHYNVNEVTNHSLLRRGFQDVFCWRKSESEKHTANSRISHTWECLQTHCANMSFC